MIWIGKTKEPGKPAWTGAWRGPIEVEATDSEHAAKKVIESLGPTEPGAWVAVWRKDGEGDVEKFEVKETGEMSLLSASRQRRR